MKPLRSTIVHRLLVVVVLLALVLTGVPADEPNRTSVAAAQAPQPLTTHRVYMPMVSSSIWGQPPIVPDTTNSLGTQTTQHLTAVSPDGSVFTFDQMTPELAAVAPGEIIVAGPSTAAPNGFLRQVTAVNASGTSVVLQTTPATLEDAIQQAAFSAQGVLDAKPGGGGVASAGS